MALRSVTLPGAGETVIRGELVDRPDVGPSLVAIRRLRWGTSILAERPLLLVEADPNIYLRAPDADPRLVELADALGDASRLAAYIAFKQLHERRQKELLSFWREGIEETDPLAKALFEQNTAAAAAFASDHPELSKLVYWNHFVLVASIFGRFGMECGDGSRALYTLCSHVRHSCQPNAAWFTLRHGFPKGRRLLHVISLQGIQRGEEISVSGLEEQSLVQPRPQRALRLLSARPGTAGACGCARCTAPRGEEVDLRVRGVLGRLSAHLAVRPPTDQTAWEAHACIRELDVLLPFSMQLKAKAKVMLAGVFGELSKRAAWQDESLGANIVQWTGYDPDTQEQRLKETKKLYETAGKDFEYLLGQDALPLLQRMEAGYSRVMDQHKLLAKYAKDGGYIPEDQPQTAVYNPNGYYGKPPAAGPGLPPTWDELFKVGQKS